MPKSDAHRKPDLFTALTALAMMVPTMAGANEILGLWRTGSSNQRDLEVQIAPCDGGPCAARFSERAIH